MTARRPVTRKPKVLNGVGMPYALRLDEWGYLLRRAFGETPYLVGTAAVSKQWRDVDVRMIFDDEKWDHWIGRHETDKSMIATWHVLVMALSAWGREFTGLPIDFQFQLRSDIKDEDWRKPRLPLGHGFYGTDVITKDDMPKEHEYAERILSDAGWTLTPPLVNGDSRADDEPAKACLGSCSKGWPSMTDQAGAEENVLNQATRKAPNDETMDAIRVRYEVLDRIIKNPQYDGKAIKAEAWEAFQEIRHLRRVLATLIDHIDENGVVVNDDGRRYAFLSDRTEAIRRALLSVDPEGDAHDG